MDILASNCIRRVVNTYLVKLICHKHGFQNTALYLGDTVIIFGCLKAIYSVYWHLCKGTKLCIICILCIFVVFTGLLAEVKIWSQKHNLHHQGTCQLVFYSYVYIFRLGIFHCCAAPIFVISILLENAPHSEVGCIFAGIAIANPGIH